MCGLTLIFLHAEHSWMGFWHPILVHFPIVLFTLALLFDLLFSLSKMASMSMGNWMLIGGTLFLIPNLITGFEARDAFPPDDPAVHSHMIRALIMSFYAFLYTAVRLYLQNKSMQLSPLVYVVSSLFLVALVYWTSDYGGVLSHGKTPFPTFF